MKWLLRTSYLKAFSWAVRDPLPVPTDPQASLEKGFTGECGAYFISFKNKRSMEEKERKAIHPAEPEPCNREESVWEQEGDLINYPQKQR